MVWKRKGCEPQHWDWHHSGVARYGLTPDIKCVTCRGTGEFSRKTSPNSSAHGLTEYASCSCCDGKGYHDK
jgi:hypothetical protein